MQARSEHISTCRQPCIPQGQTLGKKALLQFIRDKLADYKVPKQIILLPALPKNATGKILKTELRKQAVK